MTEGKCDYCPSKEGHWTTDNLWTCHKCDRITAFYEITELGRQVLKELGVQSSVTRTNNDEV